VRMKVLVEGRQRKVELQLRCVQLVITVQRVSNGSQAANMASA